MDQDVKSLDNFCDAKNMFFYDSLDTVLIKKTVILPIIVKRVYLVLFVNFISPESKEMMYQGFIESEGLKVVVLKVSQV